MKKNHGIGLFLILTVFSVSLCSAAPTWKRPWLGVHVMLTTKDKTEQLTQAVKDLARMGVNSIVAEINYGYEYESHPELRSGNPSTKESVKKLVDECRRNNVRLIPQFQCLGHQSWKASTFPLLTKYPQLDETPGKYPGNEGIYCRSWCPLHSDVNPIVFALMDELIDAFEADALHVGMDEVFLIGEDACPRCKGKSKAELFAKAVNDYHEHIVGKRKIEMLMWADRLIDAGSINYGKWEASANGTAAAIDLIAKDIIVCDWHYGRRQAYESIPMFLAKGFRVWPASWREPDAAKSLIDYSRTFDNPRMVGHLNTTWGAVPIRELTAFKPLTYSTSAFAPSSAEHLSETAADDIRRRFLTFCDLAVAEFNKEITRFADREDADPATHHMPFFEDAHAVRALAVAYDLTGRAKYLAACRRWSDRIVEYQSRMIPAGAYYMNHSRAPGQDKGQWNVADSGSIAMGVLATAIRCEDPTEKEKYLESVKVFARLVMENYIDPEGGISNGLWPAYDGQWWCSTATFGTTAFALYEETGRKEYLAVAKGALEWMTRQDFREVKPITFQQRPSGIIFYCFELYATGLRYLKPASPEYERAINQIDLALDWMAKNQKTRGADVPDYLVKNVDMAGLPYLMYAFARQLPQYRELTGPADGELSYIGDLLLRDGTPNVSRLMVWEVMTWAMMSYAERLSPAAMHRTSKQLRAVVTPTDP